jgi:NADPH:quinone reductase-like Zn-dependent oxidoreductase
LNALTLTATGGPEQLLLQEVPRPAVEAPDDVLVRIQAAALNRLDLWVLSGLQGLTYRFPHIMGSDGAGVVEAVGAGVSRTRCGDRVLLNPGLSCGACESCRAGAQPLCADFQVLGEHRAGTMGEFIVVPERNVAPVPPGMSWEQAAAFPLATLTAWRMLITRARLTAGETVLIWGIGGGVALAALRVVKEAGGRAIVTSSSDEKLARARALGADATFNHSQVDVVREVRGLTDRRGVEIVVDSVGEATWERSLRCLGRLGRLVTCGGTTGSAVSTDVRRLFWYQWTIMGSTMGSDADFRAVTRLAHAGRLWPEIDRIYPITEAASAFRRLAAGAQFGKIVVMMQGPGAGGATGARGSDATDPLSSH